MLKEFFEILLLRPLYFLIHIVIALRAFVSIEIISMVLESLDRSLYDDYSVFLGLFIFHHSDINLILIVP